MEINNEIQTDIMDAKQSKTQRGEDRHIEKNKEQAQR